MAYTGFKIKRSSEEVCHPFLLIFCPSHGKILQKAWNSGDGKMLHNCLRWFYCLPIPQAFLLMVIFSVLFLFLRKMLEKKRFWQLGVSAFVLLWIILIIAATLMSRSIAESRITPVPIPFSSYYLVIDCSSLVCSNCIFANSVLNCCNSSIDNFLLVT